MSLMRCALAGLVLLSTISAPARALDLDGDGLDDLVFHNPGSTWSTLPALFSTGSGWSDANRLEPGWANVAGVQLVTGDFNGDGADDVAAINPGSTWSTVPVMFAPGSAARSGVERCGGSSTDGTCWYDSSCSTYGDCCADYAVVCGTAEPGRGDYVSTNSRAPSWANAEGSVAISGDFNGDGRTDIAIHNPGGVWSSVPVLESNGDGTWTAQETLVPSWASAEGNIALPGDFNGDGLGDVAFYNPGSSWGSVPVLMGDGDGVWLDANRAVPSWANQPGVVAQVGDFDGDGADDIAFHRPGSTWLSVPVLLSNPDGSWDSVNDATSAWANADGATMVVGDFDGDGVDDLAFQGRGEGWSSLPVLLSDADGTWTEQTWAAHTVVNDFGVNVTAGDFNGDGIDDLAFHRSDGAWGSVPMLLGDDCAAWTWVNPASPSWANASGVIALGEDRATLPMRGDAEVVAIGQGLWAADATLMPPSITGIAASNGALTVRWSPAELARTERYTAFLYNTTDGTTCTPATNHSGSGSFATSTSTMAAYNGHRAWQQMTLTSCFGQPLEEGDTYQIELHAVSASGISYTAATASVTVQTSPYSNTVTTINNNAALPLDSIRIDGTTYAGLGAWQTRDVDLSGKTGTVEIEVYPASSTGQIISKMTYITPVGGVVQHHWDAEHSMVYHYACRNGARFWTNSAYSDGSNASSYDLDFYPDGRVIFQHIDSTGDAYWSEEGTFGLSASITTGTSLSIDGVSQSFDASDELYMHFDEGTISMKALYGGSIGASGDFIGADFGGGIYRQLYFESCL